MALFPFFVKIEDQPGLILGGGHHAWEKVEKLLPYGPELLVLAEVVSPQLQSLARQYPHQIQLIPRAFQEKDLLEPNTPAFVIAALEDREENHRIAALCQQHRIPVNVVDDPAWCTFVFPSLIRKGQLSVGISTAGASPAAAVWLRKRIQDQIPDDIEGILDWLQAKRPQIQSVFLEKKARAAFYHALTAICMEENRILSDEEWEELLSREWI